MNLETLKKTLHGEFWYVLANRIAFKEHERRCKDGEIPGDRYNQVTTAITFEALQRNQIMALCRLDEKKNISFRTVSQNSSKFGYSTDEAEALKAAIDVFNKSIRELKTEHRNMYLGHLSEKHTENVEIIDFDPMILEAFRVLTLICKEEPKFFLELPNTSSMDMAASFRTDKG